MHIYLICVLVINCTNHMILLTLQFSAQGVLHEKKTSVELGKLIGELHVSDLADLDEWEKVTCSLWSVFLK